MPNMCGDAGAFLFFLIGAVCVCVLLYVRILELEKRLK